MQMAGGDGVVHWGNHGHRPPTFPYCAAPHSPTRLPPPLALELVCDTQHPTRHPLPECTLSGYILSGLSPDPALLHLG